MVGFSDSMDLVFLLAAAVVVVAFLLLLFLPQLPLRTGPDMAREPGSPPEEQPGISPTGFPNGRADGVPYQEALAAKRPQSTTGAASLLSDGPVLTGRVEGPDRSALAGAVLTVTDFPGHQVARGVSDADGWYRLALPTGGTYLLICAAENRQPVASMVAVGMGEVRRDLTLVGASQVEGRVLRQGGEPIHGATVTLTDARGEVVGAAVTGPDGGYVLADLYAGEYTLTATAEGARPVARSVAVDSVGSHLFDVVLRSNATVTGTVRAARSGLPVAEASVTLVDGYGNVVGASITGADGRYEFADLLPGTYTLTASGFAPVASRIDLVGERADRDMTLGHPGPVTSAAVSSPDQGEG
jgi:hypothetical protein